jgi:hypothetical protein
MEINGSYFSDDISQSAMLLALMHGLGESIMLHLNDKYFEHVEEKESFRIFRL